LAQEKSKVVSLTNHFTTMINAVLTAPDQPPPLQFNPNSIKDFAAADPAQNIDLIEPPAPNNRGTAELSFPIRLPAGRGAYSPQLTLAYSSDRAYSWVGYGWSIDLPQISIDTRWGVPRYDYAANGDSNKKDYTKERYLLNGQPLVPVNGSGNEKCRTENSETLAQFAPRIQSFQRILMCSKPSKGGSITDRYWEVTYKDGTYFEYGRDEMSRLVSYRKDEKDHIAAWYLRRVIDTNGNITEYEYEKDTDQNLQKYSGEPFVGIYPSKILYTSHLSEKSLEPAYKVLLKRECTDSKSKDEYPIHISGRNGFKTLSRCRLDTIDVNLLKPNEKLIRSYKLQYKLDQYFGKLLLDMIKVKGDNGNEFYNHRFYYNDPEYIEEPEFDENLATKDNLPPIAFKKMTPKSANHGDLKPKLLSYTKETGNAGSFGVGIEAGIGGLASCSIGEEFRIDVDNPEPILRHMDVNGDRITDRVWIGQKGISVMIGSDAMVGSDKTSDDSSADPPPTVQTLNLSNLGRDRTLSYSVGISAGCSIGAEGMSVNAGGGLTINSSVTGTKNMLADANGDGLVDLTWGDRILPGLPSHCRDGIKPNCKSTDPICQCSDGLLVCNQKDALCFGKSKISPDKILVSQASSTVSLAGYQGAKRVARTASRLPINSDRSEPQKGFNVKKALLLAEAYAADAPDIMDPLDTITDPIDEPPVIRKASGHWGAYTAIINRYKLEAERDPENIKKPSSYRSVIRWDVQHNGTVKIDAQVRRSFIIPN